MRKLILSILGLAILVGAIYGAKAIADSNKRVRPKAKKVVKTVFVDTVKNGVVPIIVEAKGNLIAKRRLELFSEVQGILKPSSKLFKAGQSFRKGETLIRLDAAEYYATVQSVKSNLYNQLASIMPDLRLDYPEIFPKWQAYLSSFDMSKSVPELPEMTSEKEKYFISGRNIVTSYYNVKNLEQRLSKYSIRAPFNGILTEAMVTEGTLVRPGQKLGEFIDTGVYELPVAVSKSYADLLAVGKDVKLTNIENTKEYMGKVSRINGNVDLASQTIDAFIEVKDESLREGMYLEANLDVREVENAISVKRSLLQPNDQLYVLRDSILDLIDVEPVYFSEKNVVVKGVPNGAITISKMVPGAYAGMLVKVYEGSQNEAADPNDEVAIKKN